MGVVLRAEVKDNPLAPAIKREFLRYGN